MTDRCCLPARLDRPPRLGALWRLGR